MSGTCLSLIKLNTFKQFQDETRPNSEHIVLNDEVKIIQTKEVKGASSNWLYVGVRAKLFAYFDTLCICSTTELDSIKMDEKEGKD